MKTIKSFIAWLIVWISLLTIWAYASTTWTWTLWSLFELVTSLTKSWDDYIWEYRLSWDMIKNDTVDTTELEDWTMEWEDLSQDLQDLINACTDLDPVDPLVSVDWDCWEVDQCTSWIYNDITDSLTEYKWDCKWENWWSDATCSETIPLISVDWDCWEIDQCTSWIYNDVTDSSTEYKWECKWENWWSDAICTKVICPTWEHIEWWVCVSDNQPCYIVNWEWIKTWNWASWSSCEVVNCDYGYTEDEWYCYQDKYLLPFDCEDNTLPNTWYKNHWRCWEIWNNVGLDFWNTRINEYNSPMEVGYPDSNSSTTIELSKLLVVENQFYVSHINRCEEFNTNNALCYTEMWCPEPTTQIYVKNTNYCILWEIKSCGISNGQWIKKRTGYWDNDWTECELTVCDYWYIESWNGCIQKQFDITKVTLDCNDNSIAAWWYESDWRCWDVAWLNYWNDRIANDWLQVTKEDYDNVVSNNCDIYDSKNICYTWLLCSNPIMQKYVENEDYCITK